PPPPPRAPPPLFPGGDGDAGDKVTEVTKTISFDDEEKTILETSDISEDIASIKITVTGITGSASDWWFWANTDGSTGDKIEWKTGEGEACIYDVTITDANKIKYIKENGLAIKGATGLTAKVTVKITKSETTGDDKTNNDAEDNGGGATTGGDTTGGSTSGGITTGGNETGTDSGNSGTGETTTTLPTKVTLIDFVSDNYDSTKRETIMTKSETSAIWTCQLTVSNQWPNFNVKATFGENDVLYKGGELKLAESGTITKDGSNDIWCDVGKECNGAKISVTVNFTGKEPSIKITLDEKGTEITSTTLPTKVTLIDFVSKDYDNTKRETVMTKSETSAIWTCELETQSDWQNFNVVAIVEEQEIWYNGNAEVTLDTPFDLTSNSEAVWCNVGNGKIAVTVDFTGTAPTIKIESAD
ncbi:MAG: hypothetical protein K2N58_00580, partial [Treponemataceae bacterium]|nr:hypothetical protein [Treponemataceae bacterium]